MKEAQFESGFLDRLSAAFGVDSDRDLAQELGVPTSTVSNWRSRGNIPIKQCIRAAQMKGASLDWLILGIGSKPDASFALGTTDAVNYSPIPIYDIEAAAGTGRLFDAELIETHIHFDTDQLERDGLNPAQVVGVRVRGDSMGETLHDGDRVLVDRSSRTPDGVFLLRMDDGLRIKRVQRVAGGGWMLISDNARYQSELVDPLTTQSVEIIGECRIRIGRVV